MPQFFLIKLQASSLPALPQLFFTANASKLPVTQVCSIVKVVQETCVIFVNSRKQTHWRAMSTPWSGNWYLVGVSSCWIHQPEKWDFGLGNSVSRTCNLGHKNCNLSSSNRKMLILILSLVFLNKKMLLLLLSIVSF